jgi:hypothetical protein
MEANRIAKSQPSTQKNFVPAMKPLNHFVIGREARRMKLQLPQDAPERMQAGWQFADLRIKVGAE